MIEHDSNFPERDRSSKSRYRVGFCERATFFFFEREAPIQVNQRKESRAKKFDGRSEVMRAQIDWDEIEDFLILSYCSPHGDDRTDSAINFFEKDYKPLRRQRGYANRWDDISELISDDSESTNDCDDFAEMLSLMEQLPCDADL